MNRLNTVEILAKKRDGKILSKEELAHLVRGSVDHSIPDYQLSAFLMAGRIRGFTMEETIELTHLMADSGERMDLSQVPGVKVDKHSTGGVGDKTSLIVLGHSHHGLFFFFFTLQTSYFEFVQKLVSIDFVLGFR